MARHDVRFIESLACGSEIASFRFSRPEGYTFRPGQYLTLELETDAGAESKPFTHSSAPGDDYLEITTRLSGSAFKNALLRLQPGDRARVTGPAGHLVLPPDVRRIRFLVGGVGVTPARSILRDAAQRDVAWEEAVLFHGNRDSSCMPFIEEFEAMSDHGVAVVSVLERPDETWEGHVGFITADVVRQHTDPNEGIFVVSGPPVMVTAMERVLDELGIPPERRMIERFGPA
jgi:ferredoxin-NADP reductase